MTFQIFGTDHLRDERNARYKVGVCVDCGGKPHSPGRPRCEECHHAYVRNPGGANG